MAVKQRDPEKRKRKKEQIDRNPEHRRPAGGQGWKWHNQRGSSRPPAKISHCPSSEKRGDCSTGSRPLAARNPKSAWNVIQ
jgi:hypothetical protein